VVDDGAQDGPQGLTSDRESLTQESMKELTDQGGEKMKVIENYEKAIENSGESLLKEVFAPQVRIEIPAGASDDHPVNTASYVLSQVAKPAPGIKRILSADAGNNWYFLGFEGQLEGQKPQAIDRVHLNIDGKIDPLIIYMRLIPVAQKFAELISRRLQPTGSSPKGGLR
jgi:hypothetical protein